MAQMLTITLIRSLKITPTKPKPSPGIKTPWQPRLPPPQIPKRPHRSPHAQPHKQGRKPKGRLEIRRPYLNSPQTRQISAQIPPNRAIAAASATKSYPHCPVDPRREPPAGPRTRNLSTSGGRGAGRPARRWWMGAAGPQTPRPMRKTPPPPPFPSPAETLGPRARSRPPTTSWARSRFD